MKTIPSGWDPLTHQTYNDLLRNVHISPDLKIIYLSVPKCACSSIKIYLRTMYGEDFRSVKSDPHSRQNSVLLKIDDIGGMSEFARLVSSDDVFTFSVVRDPRSRVLSAFLNKFIHSNESTRLIFGRQLFDNLSDSDIIEAIDKLQFNSFLSQIRGAGPLRLNEHWRPMYNQLLGLACSGISLFRLDDIPKLFGSLPTISGLNSILPEDFSFSPHLTNASMLVESSFDAVTHELFSEIYCLDMYLYFYLTS